jgi:hypothetical protein
MVYNKEELAGITDAALEGADGYDCSIVVDPGEVFEGGTINLVATPQRAGYRYVWTASCGPNTYTIDPETGTPWLATWDTSGVEPGVYSVSVTISDPAGDVTCTAAPPEGVEVKLRPLARGDTLPVTMRRTATAPTPDLPLWVVIRNSTEALSFRNYSKFMDILLCGLDPHEEGEPIREQFKNLQKRRALPYTDADAYRLLKIGTEAFLMVHCGVAFSGHQFTVDDLAEVTSRVSVDGKGLNLDRLWSRYLVEVNGGPDATIPYLALVRRNLKDVPLKNAMFAVADEDSDLPAECFGILRTKLTRPCLLELIWSYWQEEGMLVQTLGAISRRFQNVRSATDSDPLALAEIDPLRPLNNLLWGYIQDEQHRLSIPRRVYEYAHHYGLTLDGRAVPPVRPADPRSRFIEAFHNLLSLCSTFFKEDDDTTVMADGFPILNALKEVHLLLSEGAHNQFGDLPSTSRVEMLMQQWLLARPEFTQFLPIRVMVAYPEEWMSRVDAMKAVQGWTDVSVMHFRNLAVFGERVLLSIRYGAWSNVDAPIQAANWARFWRAEIQGYTHAYRAATGVDLTEQPDATLPSLLLRQRRIRRAPAAPPHVRAARRSPQLRPQQPPARSALPMRPPGEVYEWGEVYP